MAAAWIQLVVLAAVCLAGVQAKPNPVEVQLLMLEADSVAAVKKVITHCAKKQFKKTSKCVALQLYNIACQKAHGAHVLACVPPTGHHTVGLVTACQAGYYIKHPRGKPACFKSKAPTPHPKAPTPHPKAPTPTPKAPTPTPKAPTPTPKTPTPAPKKSPPPPAVVPTAGSPPPPATPPPPPATPRVILISVDGFHQEDLAFYVAHNPTGNLSMLSALGTSYTLANTSSPSDSFPGVLALHTGGTFKTHGMLYDNTYDRSLYPPGTDCSGPAGYQISIDETLEFNDYYYDGGVPGSDVLSKQLEAFNFTLFPYRINATGGCELVIPNTRVLANTIFDLVQTQKGGYTAWADKGYEYQILQGKTGQAVTDLYTPEIAATGSGYNTLVPPSIMRYDTLHTNAIINWIKGISSGGGVIPTGAPNLFGGNYQTVSVSQKVVAGGYNLGADNVTLTPTPLLVAAFDFIDEAMGAIVNTLKAEGLYESTTLIITAKHGQSPRNPTLLKTEVSPNGFGNPSVGTCTDPGKFLAKALNDPNEPAGLTTDDVALIWLGNQSRVMEAVNDLMANASQVCVAELFYPGAGIEQFGNPNLTDPLNIRVPDIAVRVVPGTIYTKSTVKIAEHGGFNVDDRHVAMLGVGSYFPANTVVTSAVQTTQVAWTICSILGLDCTQLTAHTAGELPMYTVPLPTS